MNTPPTGFHARDGLHFTRLENGSVRIQWWHGPTEPIQETTLTESEWASVVASVSKDSETYARWMQARRFHGTELPYDQHELKNQGGPTELSAEDEEWLNAPMGTPKPPPA